jgi:hypothetical protein
MKETGYEIRTGEYANQNAMQLIATQGEFIERRGFLLLFFRQKK